MQRTFGRAMVLTIAAALTVGLSSTAASAKFAYTAVVDDNQDLVVQFEEGALKRFAAADYQLQGDATSESPTFGERFEDVTASVTLVPDERGRVVGSLVLDIPWSLSPLPCPCGPRHVEYFDLTLTNLTTGKTYRLDPVSRDFP